MTRALTGLELLGGLRDLAEGIPAAGQRDRHAGVEE
jgi:hypothetical protein